MKILIVYQSKEEGKRKKEGGRSNSLADLLL